MLSTPTGWLSITDFTEYILLKRYKYDSIYKLYWLGIKKRLFNYNGLSLDAIGQAKLRCFIRESVGPTWEE